jgi:hypothetical protein
MPALSQIPEHFTTQFSTNWEHLLQQKVSRLKEYVTVDTITGAKKSYNQIDQTSMRLITARSATTTPQDTATAKRWIQAQGYDSVTWFDEFDEQMLGTVVLPTSETVTNHASAYKRTCDTIILNAARGTAYTGETGVTPTVLPVTQKINGDYVKTNTTIGAAGWGNSDGTILGMTLDKLIKAKSILARAEVDDEDPLILVISQAQLDDMLNNITEVKSSDYANVKALVEGQVDRFMGFKIIRTELVPTGTDNSAAVRFAIAYAKSGIVLADEGRKVHMDVLPQQNHTLQIRSVASLGATRKQEKKVVEISCLDN